MEKAGRCFLPRASGAGGVRGLRVVGRSAEARGPERIVTGPVQGPFETPDAAERQLNAPYFHAGGLPIAPRWWRIPTGCSIAASRLHRQDLVACLQAIGMVSRLWCSMTSRHTRS